MKSAGRGRAAGDRRERRDHADHPSCADTGGALGVALEVYEDLARRFPNGLAGEPPLPEEVSGVPVGARGAGR